METKTVKIEKPAEYNIIIGQSHFIKTVEDIHEAMVGAVPGIKFGMAFCESSVFALSMLVFIFLAFAFRGFSFFCFIFFLYFFLVWALTPFLDSG